MVAWTPDKDQILLRGIFDFMNISTSNRAMNEYLAAQIGEGCTPKAISHRIANLRANGKTKGRGMFNTTASASMSAPSTPRKPKGSVSAASTPKTATPASGRGRGRAKKRVIEDSFEGADEGLVDDDEEGAFQGTFGKGTKREVEEEDLACEGMEAKKVKMEQIEDDDDVI